MDLSVFAVCEEVEGVTRTPCTLLLSGELLLDFGVGLLFDGTLRSSTKTKRLYQQEGDAEIEFKFRAMNRDWLRLGVFARKLNWSGCRVFAVLLRLYLAHRSGKRIVTTKLWSFVKKHKEKICLIYLETWHPHQINRRLTLNRREDSG